MRAKWLGSILEYFLQMEEHFLRAMEVLFRNTKTIVWRAYERHIKYLGLVDRFGSIPQFSPTIP